MFVFSRPKWLRLREAGIPLGKAFMAACFEPDVGGYIEQSMRVSSSHASKSSRNMRHPSKRYLNSISSRGSGVSLPSIAEGVLEANETKKLSDDFDAQATADGSSDNS